MNWTTLYLILFLSGCAIAVMGTVMILRVVGTKFGGDSPDFGRKQHEKEISRLGGFPVFLAFVIGSTWLAQTQEHYLDTWFPVIVCSSLIFLLGFFDDIHPLGAKVKLAGQIFIACTACILGLTIEKVTNPARGQILELPLPVAIPLTVLWLIALPNLINLIDGMDGLSSGIGMFLCLTIGVISALSGDPDTGMLSLIVAGALLGFLAFNFPPAKIFLGDGGAYFVGFFIAAASLQSSNKGAVAAALLVVVIALGIPILDTLFALVRRAVRGVPLLRADAEHVHHRLLELGFTKGSALLTLYAVCALLSGAGLSLFWARGFAVPIASTVLVVLALVAARGLGYVDTFRDIPAQLRRALKNRADVRYATLLGDILELEAHRDPTPEQFWTRYEETLRRVGLTREPGETGVQVASNPDLYRMSEDPTKNWAAIAGAMHPGYHAAAARWKAHN